MSELSDRLRELLDKARHLPVPLRAVPRHIAEAEPEVRTSEGWLLCSVSSDDYATLIVEAINALPELFDTLDRLTAENLALKARDHGWSLQCDEQQAEIDRLTASTKDDGEIARWPDDDERDARSLAVELVDGIRGYTCEFAPSQREHEYWYDRLEASLVRRRAAIVATATSGQDRLREALENINRRASPKPDRTLGDCADELTYIADLARAALSSQPPPAPDAVEALRKIHAARLRADGTDEGYGWNITALNKAMDEALPLIGRPVPPKPQFSKEAKAALTKGAE